MAGSNQAPNLTGLLSGISNSFKEMGETGTNFTQNIRDYAAPEIDTEDPQSLMNFSRWAQRNGDTQTAQKYQMAASQISKTQKAQGDKTQMIQMQNALRGIDQRRQQALQGVTDPAEIAQINSNFQRAGNALGARINEYAVSSQAGGTGNEGTLLMESEIEGNIAQENKRRAAMSLVKNNPDLRHLIPAVESGALDPDTLFASNKPGHRKIHSAKIYKNGVRTLIYDNGDVEAKGPDGMTYTGESADEIIAEAVDHEGNIRAEEAWGTGHAELVLEQAATIEETVASAERVDAQLARAQTLLTDDPTIDQAGIKAMLPNMRDGARQLDAIKTEMAIDLAGMASMGVLSDSDVQNLKSAAIPDLDGPGMLNFVKQRRAAIARVRRLAMDMSQWMYQNRGTRTDYYRHLEQMSREELAGKGLSAPEDAGYENDSYGVMRSDGNTGRRRAPEGYGDRTILIRSPQTGSGTRTTPSGITYEIEG